MSFKTFTKPARERLYELFDQRGDKIYHRVKRRGVTVGKEAGTLDSTNGRHRVSVDGQQLYVSRVIYAMANDTVIRNEIDHIDGNPLNNHPSNLRDVTHTENMRNLPCHRKQS